MTEADAVTHANDCAELLARLNGRALVLVGMMGAGKTTVGRRLANRLGRKFIDSDAEIEVAAGMSIDDIFSVRGEDEFRAGEARVISRLMREGDIVLGTGGGAFVTPHTRDLIKAEGISIWLKADFDLLFARVSRRNTRPLLKTANPRETLKNLIDKRYPLYAEADVIVQSIDAPPETVTTNVIEDVLVYLRKLEETTSPNGN